MAVKDALDKIVDRHQDVIGAMVLASGDVHHNLKSPQDEFDIELVLETLTEVLDSTSMLADDDCDFAELIIEFSKHSLIARNIDGGLFAVLVPNLPRGKLMKLHVGLGISAKAIQKAVESEIAEAVKTEQAADVAAGSDEQTEPEFAPAEIVDISADTTLDDDGPGTLTDDGFARGAFRRKSRGFRGSKEMLAARFQAAPDAASDVQPKDEAPQANEEGVPLNEDGTPKTKKFYRGQVYYE